MAERIEFVGNPLPTGLPGFGGGTVSVLVLPGFNTVVAVQQFGPVVDAPTVIPPNPEPPEGSNPENPTNEVVTPANPPTQPGVPTPIFCKECEDQDDVGDGPLMYGIRYKDVCVGCDGKEREVTRYFSRLTATSEENGVFYSDLAEVTGKDSSGKFWKINPNIFELTRDVSNKLTLLNDAIEITRFGQLTSYSGDSTGPNILGEDGKRYRPQDLEVCNGTNTETWKVLAWKP
jgi:hypothetical protein